MTAPDALSWADIYTDSPPQEVPLDAAGQALVNLIPEQDRAEKEPMLRGMLAMMRLNLGEVAYVKFCHDMERAYAMHQAGDRQHAAELFGAYGIPYEMLTEYVGE